MDTRVGQLKVSYTARGLTRYEMEMWHDGLKKHRVIRGDDGDIVRRKAQLQATEWSDAWAIAETKEQDRAKKLAGKQHQEERKLLASERSDEAQQELDSLSSILKFTLSVNDAVDWEALKDRAVYSEPKPRQPQPPAQPALKFPDEPHPSDSKYQPTLGFLDKLIPSRRQRLQNEMNEKYALDHENWEKAVQKTKQTHAAATRVWQAEAAKQLDIFMAAEATWRQQEAEFLGKQVDANAAVDKKRQAYEAREPEAIVDYCDLVLSASRYPDYFPQEFDLDYNAETLTLVVDYVLPAPDDLPRLKSVKYIASRDELDEQFISEAQAVKLYDEVLYQVVLRTIHELYEADIANALNTIVFNGIVTSVDRSTGKSVTACVLSLRAEKAEFLAINLALVDPKACFKSLKGIGSSKLHGLAPVPPIMQLRREDGRFVSAYEVANTLDASVNLAAMDWEDFEHLIREVFEKEFSSTGGEVRVTQASRDGGVDAVAFDPDPIRGGKIVIQAKRYTNTVGVGAVRDLYGTVVNEGATKGVLVTTSDYGPDSYAFANGKPLVLLSGANLLHMLEKHGHKARIDIKEAKQLAGK